MDNAFSNVIDNTLYKLDTTLEAIGLSSDELYAYAKKYKFNTNELESFITQRYRRSMDNQDKKINLTEADYLELLRRKRLKEGANYADSMVFYKGKVLGRCPAGTTRVGRTCAPSAAGSVAPKYGKQSDLGGLAHRQVRALSKARTSEDIIKAHKKSDKA